MFGLRNLHADVAIVGLQFEWLDPNKRDLGLIDWWQQALYQARCKHLAIKRTELCPKKRQRSRQGSRKQTPN
jgi:hypothetical protein